jgi:hypothetical protein
MALRMGKIKIVLRNAFFLGVTELLKNINITFLQLIDPRHAIDLQGCEGLL